MTNPHGICQTKSAETLGLAQPTATSKRFQERTWPHIHRQLASANFIPFQGHRQASHNLSPRPGRSPEPGAGFLQENTPVLQERDVRQTPAQFLRGKSPAPAAGRASPGDGERPRLLPSGLFVRGVEVARLLRAGLRREKSEELTRGPEPAPPAGLRRPRGWGWGSRSRSPSRSRPSPASPWRCSPPAAGLNCPRPPGHLIGEPCPSFAQ